MATASDIQALIDSKVTLIQSLISTISTISTTPKPSYVIDGQSVQWASYLDTLVRSQDIEVKNLAALQHLMNVVAPYQFQSNPRIW